MALRLSGLQRAVGRMLRLRVRELADKAFYIFNHMVVTHEEGAALVQAFRDDIQNTIFTVARLAARLLGQQGHWVAFIQQTQFPFRVAGGAWVQVDPAFQQIAMEISNQRANVARGVRALG